MPASDLPDEPLAPARAGDGASGDPAHEAAPPEAKSPEREELEAAPSTRCLNCGQELPGDYCPGCGQKDQPLRQPVHRFVAASVAEYVGLDGRLWPTLRALLFQPGRLTQAYILGRRRQYIRPLRVYITASLLFFFFLALMDPVGRLRDSVGTSDLIDSTMTAAAYAAVLDSALVDRVDQLARQRLAADSLARRADSLRAAFPADSASAVASGDAAGALERAEDVLEEAAEEAEDAQEWVQAMEDSDSWRRERWQREVVAGFRADSLILPADLQTASLLVYSSGEGPNLDGPQWLFSSPGAQRLRDARTPQERREAAIQFAREAVGKAPTVVFILLPIFALLLKLLYVRRGWYYSEHLVFALHVHAFTFIVFTLIGVLAWAAPGSDLVGYVALGLSLTIPLYFIAAQKRVYAQGWFRTLFKATVLGSTYGFVLLMGLVLAILLAGAFG